MKGKILAILLSTCMMWAAYGQEIGSIEFISPELEKLIKKEAAVEIVADGFQFTEGPLWLAKEKTLLFSDIPANLVYKWTEVGGKEVYLDPGGYTGEEPRGGFKGPNALLLSNDGNLLICQHGDRRIARMTAPLDNPDESYETVAGAYDGKTLNSPNDMFQAKNGDIYFTDPSYGFEKGPGDPKKELTFQGVYKVSKDGQVTLLLDSLEQPNGIDIFPDGKKILVSNSGRKKRWYVYDLGADGNLTGGRIFFDAGQESGMGGCDGFKIDKKGNVFATGPGGVFIFNPEGEQIGKIKVNGVTATNIAFTQDQKTIFITAQQYILRVKLR